MCRRLLKAQAAFGKSEAFAADGDVAFGRTLWPELDEDRNDRGPIVWDGNMAVADCRLDNREELLTALPASALVRGRPSDAAILVAGLQQWGLGLLDRIYGDFAFAWWDGARRTLTLARDPLGIRPLFFHLGSDFAAFATMPSGLLAHPAIPRGVNAAFLRDQLLQRPWRGTATPYDSIARVEPGSVLDIAEGESRSRRYWDPLRAPVRERVDPDEIRAATERAVACRMRGAGTSVATHLSGGLDSGLVTALAATIAPDATIHAFTGAPPAGFHRPARDGAIWDEWPLADKTARLYPNVVHHRVENRGSPIDTLDPAFRFQQLPAANLSNAVWGRNILAAAREQGLGVLLTGGAGNLTITYDGLEGLGELLGSGRWAAWARHGLAGWRSGTPALRLAAASLHPFLPDGWESAIRRLVGRPDLDPAALLAVETDEDSPTEVGLGRFADSRALRAAALRRSDGGTYGKSVLAEYGVSVRDPLADVRLIELCLAMPAEHYLRGGTRGPARRLAADLLPREVIDEPRRGIQAANWRDQIAGDLPAVEREIEYVRRSPSLSELFDRKALAAALTDWERADALSHRGEDLYKINLLRAIAAIHFVRKVEGTN